MLSQSQGRLLKQPALWLADFCLLLLVSSDCAQPITGQVIEVTCPVIGWAQPELTLSKRQKTSPCVMLTGDTSCHLTSVNCVVWGFHLGGWAVHTAALILGLCPANERRRYIVTTSLIGWAQTYNQPWYSDVFDVFRSKHGMSRRSFYVALHVTNCHNFGSDVLAKTVLLNWW